MYGGFDLNRIVQAVDQANPGLPPQAKLRAIENLTKLFNPQQALEFKQMQIMQRAEGMGINAAMKLQDINTKRQAQGFPPITMQEAMQGGMLGGAETAQQPQQPAGTQMASQQPQVPQQDLFAGVDPGQLQRATNLGWNRDTIAQAAQVYQQTGKPPTGLGTRPQAAFIQGIIKQVTENINRQQGIGDQQMTAGWQKYHSEGKFQDVAATYGARVENAVNELKQLIPQAAASSSQYKRSDVVALNELYNKWKQQQSDPRFNDLLIASFGTISAYTRAMNPTGAPRVADRLETEAIKLLSTAVGPEAYMTQLRRMWKEAQASQTATYETGKQGRRPGDINTPMPGDTGQGAQGTTGPVDIGGGWSVQEH